MQGPINVLDCTAGYGVLWESLKKNFDINSYYPLDKQKRPKALKLDSKRFLKSADLSRFNVIDIDTYGSCFEHYQLLMKNKSCPSNLAIFLTDILVKICGGNVSNKVLESQGIYFALPKPFSEKVLVKSRGYMLKLPLSNGSSIKKCFTSEFSQGGCNKWYAGLLIGNKQYGNYNSLDGLHI